MSDPGEALVRTSSFGSVPFLAEPSDLSAVADMLRGPLTELATSAGLFTDDFASLQRDQQREIAFSMHRRATELQYLVENLLLAATIREGHFLARTRNLALADLISEAEPAWTPLLRHRGQTLRVRVSNQLPEVSGDPRRVAQALMNLIYNALTRAEPNTLIDLVAEEELGSVRVTVADSGADPTEETGARFTQPFDQIESGLRSGDAPGLGLSIVKLIIESHGGRVGVATRSGGGACFWFELPFGHRGVST